MTKWSRRRRRWVVVLGVVVAVLAGFYALGRHYEAQDRRAKAAAPARPASSAPAVPTQAPAAPTPTKAPPVAPKSEPPKVPAGPPPASAPHPEVPSAEAVPGRPLQPSETTKWAAMLRADDTKAPGRPQLGDYELAFSTATRMCMQQPDEIVKLTRRLAAKKSPLFDGAEGRAYSALGWMAAAESRPQSDCSTAGSEME